VLLLRKIFFSRAHRKNILRIDFENIFFFVSLVLNKIFFLVKNFLRWSLLTHRRIDQQKSFYKKNFVEFVHSKKVLYKKVFHKKIFLQLKKFSQLNLIVMCRLLLRDRHHSQLVRHSQSRSSCSKFFFLRLKFFLFDKIFFSITFFHVSFS
jgi:hypothetical protein